MAVGPNDAWSHLGQIVGWVGGAGGIVTVADYFLRRRKLQESELDARDKRVWARFEKEIDRQDQQIAAMRVRIEDLEKALDEKDGELLLARADLAAARNEITRLTLLNTQQAAELVAKEGSVNERVRKNEAECAERIRRIEVEMADLRKQLEAERARRNR